MSSHILVALIEGGYRIPVIMYIRGRIANKICIASLDRFNEEEVIRYILHEEAHWAQNMFLSRKENKKVLAAYRRQKMQHKVPFVEWINPFDGGYDMSEWEEKYGHKYESLL